MLSVREPIKAIDIYSIKDLKTGQNPVFQLFGFGDANGKVDSIVVKMEEGDARGNFQRRDVRAAAKHMEIVDPRSRTEILNPAEISALKLWAMGGTVPDAAMLQLTNMLATQLGRRGVWVKMATRKLIKLDTAVLKRLDPNNPDDTDVRIIGKALRDKGGLEKLGMIVAADLFNGNTDRFTLPDPHFPGTAPGTGGIPMQVVTNVGNVLVASVGGNKAHPIGLDSYDPMSEWKNVDSPTPAVGNTWGGLILRPNQKAARKSYAEKIVSDLEALLGARNRTFRNKNQLGTRRKSRINNGMEEGAKKLKKALRTWRRRFPNQDVKGVKAKMDLLGW